MAHRYDVYRYGPGQKYIEHEYKCKGKYGAKGEERAPKEKATPEQIKKQNQYNREKEVLRVMRDNFEEGDLWTTFKLPKGTRMSVRELLDLRDKLLRNIRNAYKRRGQMFKYVYRIDIGERGGIHIHVLVNRLEGKPWTAGVISAVWKKLTGGHTHYTPVYEEGGFKQLASYLVKPVCKEIEGQLTLFGTEEEVKVFSRYGSSRNLKRPQKENHEYKKRTVKKLVEEGPEPTPGYYIDRDSIRYGENPYTGMTYYYYTEIRMDRQDNDIWEDLREKVKTWWHENISTKKKRRKGGDDG